MFKTIFISLLSTILLIALGVGAYSTLSSTNGSTFTAETQDLTAVAQAAENNPASGSDSSAVPSIDHFADGSTPFAAQGNTVGQGYRGGRNASPSGNQPAAQNNPSPQADLSQMVTLEGSVVKYEYGTLTLSTENGEVVAIQLGNQNYLRSINFVPVQGENLTVIAFPGEQGLLTAVSITRMSDGSVYNLRDNTIGRPLWAGGASNGSTRGRSWGRTNP